MRRVLPLLAVLLASAPRFLAAQEGAVSQVRPPIRYEIAFPNRAHHEAEVTVVFDGLVPGTLEVRMSRSSPGRYSLHEFAKNVYGVSASDRDGAPLEIKRPDPHQWNVSGHSGYVRMSYTLYGDRADGTYAGIDRTHAHLNMPATFVWARGLEDRPVRVTFIPPDGSGWRVATQLAPTADPFTFEAPGLQYFMDSPTVVADFQQMEWEVGGGAESQTVRIALLHQGDGEDAERYADGVKAIVREAGAFFGGFPRFDYGTYTFLATYLPWVAGDGMEHRNSTMLTSTASIERNVLGLWGTVAHEFIHAWNVERIRPDDLQPFDFEEANMSRGLWFAEGFTSYIDDLLLIRSELIDRESFARRLGGSINSVVNSPGRQYFSPVEMSMQAPFTDRASSADPTNRANTFISYYTWGSVVGAGLDLALRSRGGGLSLDGYMRAVWRRHGGTDVPYTVDDLETVLAAYTSDPSFASDFFGRFVNGGEVPDFESLLAAGGMLLRPANPAGAWPGSVSLGFHEGGATINANTRRGSPLFEAGLDRRDRIIRVDGRRITSRETWMAALEGKHPGDELRVEYDSRGSTRTATLRLTSDPRLEVVTFEDAGLVVSEEVERFRREWLEPKGR
ncbi:MAG: M61 family metallopeptidase [Gemmatimonadota bacterium]|nr:MAG: M61 family metallopeptidase [Gemmatimonadota bacterium]